MSKEKCKECQERTTSYVIINRQNWKELKVCEKCVKMVFEKNGKVKVFPAKDSEQELQEQSSIGSYTYEVQEI